MDYTSLSCSEFVQALSSKAPVPGGGGTSALVGALGTALGNMVGSLTVGKKKYADVEEEMQGLKASCDRLQTELLQLVQRDAEVFEPLAAAYGMPKSTEEERMQKEKVMESALLGACEVPLQIMEKCCEAVLLLEQFASKGSVLAVSDAGVGAALCRSAIQGVSLNVFINTKAMKDRKKAEELNRRADDLLERFVPMADEIFRQVADRLR